MRPALLLFVSAGRGARGEGSDGVPLVAQASGLKPQVKPALPKSRAA